MDPVLDACGITKRYGDTAVLAGVDLQIPAGSALIHRRLCVGLDCDL